MLQALLVTFREGIEAFLIVGIVVAYLKKTQRAGLVRGVRIGLAIRSSPASAARGCGCRSRTSRSTKASRRSSPR